MYIDLNQTDIGHLLYLLQADVHTLATVIEEGLPKEVRDGNTGELYSATQRAKVMESFNKQLEEKTNLINRLKELYTLEGNPQ